MSLAFVTGGGSGIGRAIAEALAAAGAPVAVMDLLPEGATETIERIRSRGGRAELLRGDVGRWEDVDAAVTRAVETLGPLGVMVNAAGIIDGYTPAAEMTPALIDSGRPRPARRAATRLAAGCEAWPHQSAGGSCASGVREGASDAGPPSASRSRARASARLELTSPK